MATGNRQNRLSQPFIPDSKLIFTLPPGFKVRKGNVIITGTVVISGVTAAGTAIGEGGPINLIKRVIVNATPAPGSPYPGGRLVDCSPRGLLRKAITEHNGKFVGELSGSVLGNGANGTYSIYLSIPIYWEKGSNRNPMATALNLDGVYSNVQVEIDTADLTNCFAGNNGTVNYAGLQLQWVDDRVAIAQNPFALYMEDHVMLIAATQKRALDFAMPQNGAFLSWLIMQEQSGSYTLADTLLNKVRLDSPSLLLDQYLSDIKQDMIDNEWIDPSQSSAGLAFLDFTDGLTGNAVPAANVLAQFDVNNVSGANLDDLLIFTERIFQVGQ